MENPPPGRKLLLSCNTPDSVPKGELHFFISLKGNVEEKWWWPEMKITY